MEKTLKPSSLQNKRHKHWNIWDFFLNSSLFRSEMLSSAPFRTEITIFGHKVTTALMTSQPAKLSPWPSNWSAEIVLSRVYSSTNRNNAIQEPASHPGYTRRSCLVWDKCRRRSEGRHWASASDTQAKSRRIHSQRSLLAPCFHSLDSELCRGVTTNWYRHWR